jgi:signal transduction histidine kinase
VAHEPDSFRRGIRDLVALTSLPAVWAGGSPQWIAESLADVLLTTLNLDIILIHLKNPPKAASLKIIQTPHRMKGTDTQRVSNVLASFIRPELHNQVITIPHPLDADMQLQIIVVPIGYNGKDGCVVAGTQALSGFSEIDQLLLSVGANQAVTSLQQAQLLDDLRRANQQKDELLEKEQAARREAEEANQAQTKFLAMISHELRTPLTSIKGFASSLMAEDVSIGDEDQRDFIRIIDSEADRLAELVNQLLDLSSLQAQVLHITAQKVSLRTLIESAKPTFELLAQKHRLVIDIPYQIPLVIADTRRLEQVFYNLIQNAVKYSPAHTTITINCFVREHELQIDITDQGIGIPKEDKQRVFEPFRQLKRNSDAVKGAGLGLAICKGLIEAHGGKIWVQDQAAIGTTISFTLPTASILSNQIS